MTWRPTENGEPRLIRWWNDRGAAILAIIFTATFSWLSIRQHDAFQTSALDLAKFDQAIWNTLHGRLLFSTLENQSILANHFSPFLALLSPLFLIWSDVRILFLVQILGLAVAGLLLYKIIRARYPAIAPWFLLAFYLNPALHEVALVEFRRVTLAVPFLALALYALYVRKRWPMLGALLLALLCKESIGILVVMVGFYLLLFERDWKWGGPLMILGGAWVVSMTLWVIPGAAPGSEQAVTYPQLNYFDLWGSSFGEIITNMLRHPLALAQRAFDKEGILALWRTFLPLGLVLPFLAPDWLLISLPSIGLMLLSSHPEMHRLADWYMASVLPFLFAAMAVGLGRLSDRRARWLTVGLLGTALIGFRSYSQAPFGGRYDPSRFAVTAHDRLADEVVRAVPADARVAAQDPYVPHLSHRDHIYLYPWISIGKDNIDYFVLDRHADTYPLNSQKMNLEIDNMVADTSYVIELEADGLYLFHRDADPLPAFPIDRVAEGSMRLDRVEVAVPDERGFFRSIAQQPIELEAGQEIRVTLYWEALAPPNAERTVSVRISDASGNLVAQHDSIPGKGNKPTSWWETGWKIRDVYYLTLPPQTPQGPGSLDLVLYDTNSLEVVPFDDGPEILQLCDVTWVP